MSDDKKVEKIPEAPRNTNVNFSVPTGWVRIELDITNIHQAVGELEAIKQDVLDLERIPRQIKNMQEAQKKQALKGGGSGVINGIKHNKDMKI